MDELLEGLEPHELHMLAKVATRKADRMVAPTHVIVSNGRDLRPRYLVGTRGRVGGWASDRRMYFYPVPGTEAYRRGREWRIDHSLLKPIETKEA